MARFYGTVQGRRGPASRLGDTSSGLHVTAQSYSGDIVVGFKSEDSGTKHNPVCTDMVHIVAREHGGGQYFRMYYGNVADLLTPEGVAAWVFDHLSSLSDEQRRIVMHKAIETWPQEDIHYGD